jgi:hypothetical protein
MQQGTTGWMEPMSVQITLTETQRKMVVRSLATTMENMRTNPSESLLDFESQEWMALIAQFATAEEVPVFVPLLCKYRSICPHVPKDQSTVMTDFNRRTTVSSTPCRESAG